MNDRILKNQIHRLMQKYGFEQQGNTWYLGSEIIQVLNLQKSKYGNRFYINLGIFVTRIADKNRPKVYQCHLYGRLCSLFQDYELGSWLDFDNSSVSTDDKARKICDAIEGVGLPLLSRCSSIDGLKDFLKDDQIELFLVHAELQSLLSQL